MAEESYKHRELTDTIICCFYTVYNTLGYGFLEKVYENALLAELEIRGISALAQSPSRYSTGTGRLGNISPTSLSITR